VALTHVTLAPSGVHVGLDCPSQVGAGFAKTWLPTPGGGVEGAVVAVGAFGVTVTLVVAVAPVVVDGETDTCAC
jgi:hypothetical protein